MPRNDHFFCGSSRFDMCILPENNCINKLCENYWNTLLNIKRSILSNKLYVSINIYYCLTNVWFWGSNLSFTLHLIPKSSTLSNSLPTMMSDTSFIILAVVIYLIMIDILVYYAYRVLEGQD